MLINLIGSPCSNKTGLAGRFIKDHPEFRHIAIDDYRKEYKDEEDAWYQVMIAAVNSPFPIIETSGLSWRLQRFILEHPAISQNKILTIILDGSVLDFQERLKRRKKDEIPFKYKDLSIEDLIVKCHIELREKYPQGEVIITDNQVPVEEQYNKFSSIIMEFREKLGENK